MRDGEIVIKTAIWGLSDGESEWTAFLKCLICGPSKCTILASHSPINRNIPKSASLGLGNLARRSWESNQQPTGCQTTCCSREQ